MSLDVSELRKRLPNESLQSISKALSQQYAKFANRLNVLSESLPTQPGVLPDPVSSKEVVNLMNFFRDSASSVLGQLDKLKSMPVSSSTANSTNNNSRAPWTPKSQKSATPVSTDTNNCCANWEANIMTLARKKRGRNSGKTNNQLSGSGELTLPETAESKKERRQNQKAEKKKEAAANNTTANTTNDPTVICTDIDSMAAELRKDKPEIDNIVKEERMFYFNNYERSRPGSMEPYRDFNKRHTMEFLRINISYTDMPLPLYDEAINFKSMALFSTLQRLQIANNSRDFQTITTLDNKACAEHKELFILEVARFLKAIELAEGYVDFEVESVSEQIAEMRRTVKSCDQIIEEQQRNSSGKPQQYIETLAIKLDKYKEKPITDMIAAVFEEKKYEMWPGRLGLKEMTTKFIKAFMYAAEVAFYNVNGFDISKLGEADISSCLDAIVTKPEQAHAIFDLKALVLQRNPQKNPFMKLITQYRKFFMESLTEEAIERFKSQSGFNEPTEKQLMEFCPIPMQKFEEFMYNQDAGIEELINYIEEIDFFPVANKSLFDDGELADVLAYSTLANSYRAAVAFRSTHNVAEVTSMPPEEKAEYEKINKAAQRAARTLKQMCTLDGLLNVLFNIFNAGKLAISRQFAAVFSDLCVPSTHKEDGSALDLLDKKVINVALTVSDHFIYENIKSTIYVVTKLTNSGEDKMVEKLIDFIRDPNTLRKCVYELFCRRENIIRENENITAEQAICNHIKQDSGIDIEPNENPIFFGTTGSLEEYVLNLLYLTQTNAEMIPLSPLVFGIDLYNWKEVSDVKQASETPFFFPKSYPEFGKMVPYLDNLRVAAMHLKEISNHVFEEIKDVTSLTEELRKDLNVHEDDHVVTVTADAWAHIFEVIFIQMCLLYPQCKKDAFTRAKVLSFALNSSDTQFMQGTSSFIQAILNLQKKYEVVKDVLSF